MPGSVVERWHRLPTSGKAKLVATILGVALCLVAAVSYMVNSDGLSVVDPDHPGYSYLAVFLLVAFDGVIPIFPAETTLNAASTLAAQGKLDLGPIILMGALGAIVGDSTLFWLARKNAHRFERQVEHAKANDRVRQALDMMDSSAPILIVAGRYVPGVRFVVNATMGLSTIQYRRFLLWSVVSGALWSVYTCVLAYQIGRALGDYPVASLVISGVVTTIIIAIVFIWLRRQRRRTTREADQA